MRFSPTLLASAVAVPLAAQQPMGTPGPMEPVMGHMMQMMGPMARVMAFTPAHVLMHKDVLHLTDPQVARLTALRDAAKTAEEAATSEIQTHSQALMTAMAAAAPDTTQLRVHFQAMQAAMAKAHWAMLAAAAQVRALLTDAQRSRADGWADAMEHMMPMMGGGMPMMPPGMMRQGPDSARRD